MASRYYQLLTGHAAIGSCLHERAEAAESSERWWCSSGERYRAWAPQQRRLWRRIGRDCGWKHPRAPAVKWLWEERATEAVLAFSADTRVGCRSPLLATIGPVKERGEVSEGEVE